MEMIRSDQIIECFKVDLARAFKKLAREDALVLDIELYLLKVYQTISYTSSCSEDNRAYKNSSFDNDGLI